MNCALNFLIVTAYINLILYFTFLLLNTYSYTLGVNCQWYLALPLKTRMLKATPQLHWCTTP